MTNCFVCKNEIVNLCAAFKKNKDDDSLGKFSEIKNVSQINKNEHALCQQCWSIRK